MNIINVSKVLLISMCILATQAHSLGYVSRACPNAGAQEAFTMSWTSNQWMVTRAYLPKIDSTATRGYRWERWDSPASLGVWDHTWRSAAGIHPWTPTSVSNYYNAVYSFHYWYNSSTRKVEKRQNFTTSCNLLNWGVNNW
jgi:hypothetical protein